MISGNSINLVGLILYFSGFSIIYLLWMLLICLRWKEKKPIHKFNQITILLCFTSGLLCMIGDTIRMYLCWSYNKLMLSSDYWVLKAISNFFYFCLTSSLHIFLLGRVYLVFKDSHFALSKKTIYILVCLIIIFIVTGFTLCVSIFIYADWPPTDLMYFSFWNQIIVDFIISTCLICLFFSKLRNLISMTVVVESESEQERNTVDLQNKTYSHFTSIITRQTITSGFALFFNQIFYQMAWISVKWWHIMDNSYFWSVVVYGSRMIGIIGVTISILFSIKYTNKLYFRLCSCCHALCYKVCSKCTKETTYHQTLIMQQTDSVN
eukprot:386216_1